jgi:hypothetical protein
MAVYIRQTGSREHSHRCRHANRAGPGAPRLWNQAAKAIAAETGSMAMDEHADVCLLGSNRAQTSRRMDTVLIENFRPCGAAQ